MDISEIIKELQDLIVKGVSKETPVVILSNNEIQISRIERIELSNNGMIHIVESK